MVTRIRARGLSDSSWYPNRFLSFSLPVLPSLSCLLKSAATSSPVRDSRCHVHTLSLTIHWWPSHDVRIKPDHVCNWIQLAWPFTFWNSALWFSSEWTAFHFSTDYITAQLLLSDHYSSSFYTSHQDLLTFSTICSFFMSSKWAMYHLVSHTLLHN